MSEAPIEAPIEVPAVLPDADRLTILQAKDREDLTAVEVPEWGCTVYLRPLSGEGRDRFEFAAASDETKGLSSATLVHECACNAKGQRLFTTKGDLKILAAKSGRALRRLTKVILGQGGIGADALEAAQGNSESDQGDEPGSTSPSA